LLLTPRNQNNGAPWSVVQDITIRLNTFENVAQGINMSGYDAPNISQRTSRILVQNNLLTLKNLVPGGDGRLFQVLNGPTDVVFDHNTGFCIVAYLVSDGSPKTDFFVFRNNLVLHGVYGFIGQETGTANTTLARWFNPNWEVTNNADIGGSPTGYPAGNYFPASRAAVGFVDDAGGDYRLAPSSPYRNLGTDEKDLGADIDAIASAAVYTCDGASGVAEPNASRLSIRIFPIPSDSYLRVETAVAQGEPTSVAILTLDGREIYSGESRSSTTTIDTSTLPAGIYLVKVRAGGRSGVAKLVVAH
jgi:hypothetical protein